MGEPESGPPAAETEELVHYDPVTGETTIVEKGERVPQDILDPNPPWLLRDGRGATEHRDS